MDHSANFIKAARMLMLEKDLNTTRELALRLKIPEATMYKLMDGRQSPTAEQVIILCNKGGFSANWMLLGKGEPKLKDEVTMKTILDAIRGK